jgi:segregation and condensation protein B
MNPKLILEAMLFAAGEPLSAKELREKLVQAGETLSTEEAVAMAALTPAQIEKLLEELQADHAESGRGFFVEPIGKGWQFSTRPEAGPWVRQLFDEPRTGRLSAAALETLAIIAYRQPVSRAEIESVRGVQVDAVVLKLQERGLVRATGRSDLPGRPLVYETTEHFLEHFGLRSVDELPNVEELRRRLPQPGAPVVPASDGDKELALGGDPILPQPVDHGTAEAPPAD